MSFGKTLVGLYLAISRAVPAADYKIPVIAIPASVENVWKNEITKFYPEYMRKTAAEKRKILFHSARNAAHVKYITEGGDLNGRVVIVVGYSQIPPSKVSIVIIDEPHINADRYGRYLNRVPAVLLGATFSGRSVAKAGLCSAADDGVLVAAMPECERLYLPDTCDIAQYIAESRESHICLLVDNEHSVISYLSELAKVCPQRKLHNFYSKSAAALNAFNKNGGVLISTIRVAAEGQNFNYCNHMVVALPGDMARMSLRRVQQVYGRINRQSALSAKNKITFFYRSATMHARALLAHVDVTGFEVTLAAHVLEKRIKKVGGRSLSDAELVMIFATPVEKEYKVAKPGLPVLSREELAEVLLS